MPAVTERSPQGGLGHLFTRAVLFGGGAFLALLLFPLTITLASAGAIPLAGLLALSRPRDPREFAVLAGSATLAGWWLMNTGELPGQFMRASALLAGVTFVALTVLTRISAVHRILTALAAAAVAVTGALIVLRSSWAELAWWVQFRVGQATRAVIGAIWAGDDAGVAAQMSNPGQIQGWLESTVTLSAQLYPAIVAITVGVAMYIAAALYRRVARHPRGSPLGRLADFRFSEHLGWMAVAALTIVVIPPLVGLRTAATNVLVVSGIVYALRGIAVAAFTVEIVGTGGWILSFAITLVIFLLLPVVLGGAVVLGVVDSGMDLRRRIAQRAAKGE